MLLAERPAGEIVLGVIGRFWRPTGGLLRFGPEEFSPFSEPGYAKAAWNFRVQPIEEAAALISTETRVLATDPSAQSAFRRYWLVIGPFSSLIRRRALALIRASAEGGGE